MKAEKKKNISLHSFCFRYHVKANQLLHSSALIAAEIKTLPVKNK